MYDQFHIPRFAKHFGSIVASALILVVTSLMAVPVAANEPVPAKAEAIKERLAKQAEKFWADREITIVRNLKRPEAGVRLGTLSDMQELIQARPDKARRHVPLLVEMLKNDPDIEVRNKAGWTLSLFGTDAKAAVPILAESLKDRELTEKLGALFTLEYFGPTAAEAVPALIEVLKDEKRTEEHWRVASALGAIGPKGKAAVPELVKSLRSTRDEESQKGSGTEATCSWGFGNDPLRFRQLCPRPLEAVKYQGEAKDDAGEVSRHREMAAAALGALGPEAKSAIPVLVKILKEKPSKRYLGPTMAIKVLGCLGPEAVPPLIALLNTPDPFVREEAIRTLGYMGPTAKAAVPHLKQLLEKNQGFDRFLVPSVLEKIEKD